ncbi:MULTISPECIES: lipocalin-like domain-containing protein [unclassified Rhizobium]|jgi:hypothetical protein|uniref:lipocalin-like domain-containing protein n=1 Tax=unclassified Rhizobium TaxID=2613769 RepID=UPI001C82D326|nr:MULTISPECIES: lipocalin-like domain-containing protein [unclassified Rhizobium]MBX5162328.1 hypothetical protein [Rhizobium sp. NZLR4b]MBX5170703.1 hypothetical protein [Rhizobium sp. NZLR1b]MBX5188385.1 hypothetical protein [Rhizobium sp. NZLR3b]MBX5206549.1 hypothetical protein [Rhizobium sp. NZLR11]
METIAGTNSSQQAGIDSEVMARLAGPWHLAAIEQPDANGAMGALKVAGLLVLTPDGHMAIQVRNMESFDVDNPYSSGGYEASYGTITLDSANSTFIYHVEGALVQALVDQDLPRSYSLADDLLILTSTRADEEWRVVWRRSDNDGLKPQAGGF